MSDVYIIVEGPTEQTFIRDVLAPEIASRGIYLFPVLIGKPGHKGGNIRFDRAKNDIGTFLKQRNDTYVSTMFDYFRIDSNWPGRGDIRDKVNAKSALTTAQKADFLESATLREIIRDFDHCNAATRFIPYISMHEFEALLFSGANILAEKAEIPLDDIQAILDECPEPEEINDDPDKAPCKRLENLNFRYKKIAMGKVVSEAIGIQTIRGKCPHFNRWLSRLEKID